MHLNIELANRDSIAVGDAEVDNRFGSDKVVLKVESNPSHPIGLTRREASKLIRFMLRAMDKLEG